MIRAVLFDMDGTVFDSEKIYCACLAEVAKGSAMEKELAEVLLDISGRNRADIYAYLHARYGEEFPAEEIFAKRDERVMKQIDEEGVKAAAYIEIPGVMSPAPPEEIIDFILDRPFLFAITTDSVPLFMGTVNTP